MPIKNKPIIKRPLSVHVLTGRQRLEYSGYVLRIPICNLQRCLARSIFLHLELVLFYKLKFYLASFVNTHFTIDVVGSIPSNFKSLMHAVRSTIINPTHISCLIELTLRITVPTLVYLVLSLCCYFQISITLTSRADSYCYFSFF